VPAATAPLLIVNPVAGDGRALHLEPWLRRHLEVDAPSARMVETVAPGHARELAAQAAGQGHDRVIAVGGDGTVQEVVNGIIESGSEISMGILAGGAGNDLARSLALPRRGQDALAVALGADLLRIDIGVASRGDGASAERRYFAAAGGVGFDAQVAAVMYRRAWWQHGRIGYLLSTLWELQRFRNQAVRLRMETPDGPLELERTALFVAFANGMYYGGGMQICPSATVVDGWMDLCIVGDISRLEAIKQLPGMYRGAHVTHPAVEFQRARSVVIEGDAGTRTHLDGEPFGTVPLHLEMRHAALDVAAPPAPDEANGMGVG
jgi:diacylglycerol kinase (ATP)